MPVILIIVALFGLIAVGGSGLANLTASKPQLAQVGTFSVGSAGLPAYSESMTQGAISNTSSVAQNSAQNGSIGSLVDSQVSQTRIEPTVNTISAQDVDHGSARLRGEVDMGTYRNGIVFMVYGYDKKKIMNVSNIYNRLDDIDGEDSDRIRTYKYRNSASGMGSYYRNIFSLINDTEYYFQICVEYENETDRDVITCGGVKAFVTDDSNLRSGNKTIARATTERALNVQSTAAQINGRIDMNDSIDGLVFFVYGEDKEKVRLADIDFDKYTNVREDDENLQKTRVDRNLRGRGTYSHNVTSLDKGTKYYFQICVEYDGEADGIDCGGVREFTTDGIGREDKPDVITLEAAKITATGGTIKGEIDMNDFHDGLAFFVYGTNRSLVGDVSNADAFRNIRQRGDQLQRVSIDNDHDGRASFTRSVNGLINGTEYAYRLCVEYVDEDENGRDKLFLKCGEVEEFETKD